MFTYSCGRWRGVAKDAPPTDELSDLGDLVEVQLHRRLTAEDGDQNLQLLLVGINFTDRGRQRGERAVGDRDRVADLEVEDLDLGLGLLLLLLDGRSEPLQHLVERERSRTVDPVGRTH